MEDKSQNFPKQDSPEKIHGPSHVHEQTQKIEHSFPEGKESLKGNSHSKDEEEKVDDKE